MIDIGKLEKLVAPNENESIADAVRRRFGQRGVDAVAVSLKREWPATAARDGNRRDGYPPRTGPDRGARRQRGRRISSRPPTK